MPLRGPDPLRVSIYTPHAPVALSVPLLSAAMTRTTISTLSGPGLTPLSVLLATLLGSAGPVLAAQTTATPPAKLEVGPTAWFGPADVRIMPLGDSLTQGVGAPGGYRSPLETLLHAGGLHPDYVGSAWSNPGGPQFDNDHEGHGGYRVADLIAFGGKSTIEQWVLGAAPEVILLHIGTNDLSDPLAWERAAPDLEELLDRIYAVSPRVEVVLAKILPTGVDERNLQVEAFNRAVTRIAREFQLDGRPLRLVDMETIPSPFPEGTPDAVHPTGPIYAAMADRWAEALLALEEAPILVPPSPVPLKFTGVTSSTHESAYPPSAAANGSGLDDSTVWLEDSLHRAEVAVDTAGDAADPIVWRSNPFDIVWNSPFEAAPAESVWIEARLPAPTDLTGFELWAGRLLEFEDPLFGTDFRVFDAPARISVQTMHEGGVWIDRGEFDLRRPPRVRMHPGEWFDVQWDGVLRVRVEFLTVDLATHSSELTNLQARVALSEFKVFGASTEVGSEPTRLVSLSRGASAPIRFEAPGYEEQPYRVLGSGLWETYDPVFLEGFDLGLVADLWFNATLAGLAGAPLYGGEGLIDGNGDAEAWFRLEAGCPASWAGAKVRHRMVALDPTGEHLVEVGPAHDLLLVP